MANQANLRPHEGAGCINRCSRRSWRGFGEGHGRLRGRRCVWGIEGEEGGKTEEPPWKAKLVVVGNGVLYQRFL